MKIMMKRFLGILLSLALLLGVMPGMSVMALADSELFTLGSFDYATNTFKDASGTGSEKYKTLMIAYGRETYNNVAIAPAVREHLDLPTMDGFEKNNAASTNYSTVITMADGKTTAEIADYVKQIVFANSVIEGQDIQITITDQVVNTKTFYLEGTQHYYQYIAYTGGTNTWTDAYNAAKNMTYAGRQGYLATVTSIEEDLFIYRAANTVGWLGGTTLPHGTKTGNYYDSFTADASADDINDANWYWACGPEIGTEFFGKNPSDNESRLSGYTEADNNGYYINWSNDEPTLNEGCLTTLQKGNGYKTYAQGVSEYSWNNLSLASNYDPSWPYSVLGYFVEYGDQLVGDSGSGADGTVTASGTIAPVTHTVTFDAGTGTGTMAPVTASILYKLPQCTFTAPSDLLFVGWKDDYDALHDAGEMVNTSSLNHFTAQWADAAVATFASGGGSDNGPESIEKVPGTVINLPTNTFTAPEGKYFAGWSDGTTTYRAGASYTLTRNVTFTAQWANRILVNDGTVSNEYLPVYGFWADSNSKGQFIIPAVDLTGMIGGTITGLTFYASEENVSWGDAQFEVYMLEVEDTTISSLTDWNTMTLVRNAGSLSIDNHEMSVTLDSPFVYQGGNLLIGVLETVSGNYESCNWYGVEASDASMGGYGDDISQQDFLPKTLFNYTVSAYTVTLSGGANVTSSGGDTTQSNLSGAMTTVTYTANDGYYFPEFDNIINNGITVTRTSDTMVTVSGLPTADASIVVPDAVVKGDSSVTNAPTAEALTYNGQLQDLVTAGEAIGGEMRYAVTTENTAPADNSFSSSIPSATESGTYYVWYKVVGDSNHNDTNPERIIVSIGKAEVESPTIAAKVYNGETQTADVSETDRYTVTTNLGGTNVGNYDVVLTLKNSSNYKWTDSEEASKTLTFRIAKAQTNDVTVSLEGWSYGEAAKTPSSTATFGTPTYTYSDAENGTYTEAVPGTAGTWYVKATVEGTDNYVGGDAIVSFVIGKQSAPTLTDAQKPTAKEGLFYIDSSEEQELITEPSEVPEGYTLRYSLDGTNWSDEIPVGTDAGDYTVKVKYVGDENHTTFNGADIFVSIEKAEPDYTIPQNITATYGQTLEDVTLPPGWSWKDAETTRVGAFGENTFAATYTPADTANYKALDENITIIVNKATATIGAAPAGVDRLLYTGSAQELVTAGSDVTGGTLKYALGKNKTVAPTDETAWGTEIPTATDAGTYYVWYKVVGDENHNDTVPASPVDVTIAKASQAVPAESFTTSKSTGSDTSDGRISGFAAAKAYQISSDNGATWTDVKAESTSLDVKAGDYQIRYAGDKNHEAGASVSVTVGKKADQNRPEGLETVNVSAENEKDGEITGVSDTMEYSVDKGTTWKAVPANADRIDGLAAGEVLIRYAGTDDKNASPYAMVVVGVASKTEGVVTFKTEEGSTHVETSVEKAESSNIAEIAKEQLEEGKEVKVELEITPKNKDDVKPESVAEIGEKVEEVFAGIDTEKIVTEYLEIDLTKYVDSTKEGKISDTKKPLEIALTFDKSKMSNPVVIRTHGGEAKAFDRLSTRPSKDFRDGTYHVGDGILYLYSQYFSDFAIVYATETTYNVGFVSGTSENISPLVVEEGGKVTLPTGLKNDGYSFDGWYKDEAYTTAWNDGDTVNADITLYAKWNKLVSGVSVSLSEVKLTKAGETAQIKVNVTPSDAANTKVTYKSSDTKVAAVDENGKITAVANGTATITVTTEDGAKTATVKVTVAIPDVPKQGTSEQTTTEQPVQEPAKEEKAVISMNARLKVSQTGSKIGIKWGKVAEADGYDVYVTYCGESFSHKKPVKTLKKKNSVAATSTTITKINGKKLNLKKNFKVYVSAYKMVDGKKVRIAKTITGHVVGRKNTKYTNVKSIKLSKSKYIIKVGKTAKVKAKTVLVDKSKKQLSNAHAAEFRYASSNKNIATVDKNGKVKGVAKGTCTIYVYARNGYAKTVKVTVK